MKLRARLALVVLVTAVPVIAGVALLRERLQWTATEQSLADYARDRMLGGGREACEVNPESFPPRPWLRPENRVPPRGLPPGAEPPLGPGAPRGVVGARGAPPGMGPEPREFASGAAALTVEVRTELWAYGPDFLSRNREAPSFPTEIRAAIEQGAEHASAEWFVPTHDGIAVGVRMPWDEGPCAFVLVRRTQVDPPGAQRGLLLGTAVLLAVLLAAVMFTAGPVVERIRRLTRQVRKSAAARYANPAEVSGADEITELAEAFNAAASEVRGNLEAIESREQALRSFVENTTHDVMVPLTVLQGHLTAIRRRTENGESVDRASVLEALQEAHYMASLIHNLSAVARLEQDHVSIDRSRVDLVALVERAVARHAPIAKARGISLEHAVPPEPLATRGDVTLLEQAVSNLIHNAVRYVELGGHVAVVLARDGGRFSLRILDDGPGIPEELRSRVFERAFRSDAARSRHPGGLGLGLSIALDVARRHGFELELRSPEDGGAEFELCGDASA
jgi:signal transduction histidine kinase